MIASIDTEKPFDKRKHLCMIIFFKKLNINGTYPNTIKVIYDKTAASIILNGEKSEAFFTKIRNETKVSHSNYYYSK